MVHVIGYGVEYNSGGNWASNFKLGLARSAHKIREDDDDKISIAQSAPLSFFF